MHKCFVFPYYNHKAGFSNCNPKMTGKKLPFLTVHLKSLGVT